MSFVSHNKELNDKGYTIIHNIFSEEEVSAINKAISELDVSGTSFRRTNDLFAIRRFLKEAPSIRSMIFNNRLNELINTLFGKDYFVIRSIYFDKPAQSNWFVSYHQDLTISVNKKIEMDGYNHWTVKQGQFAVQPPLEILKSIFTIRIHLDETDKMNGALKVIPGSHLKGIHNVDLEKEKSEICEVAKGGVMLMKPLLLHSSGRSSNERRRRVVHIEFCNTHLPAGLEWSEFHD